MLQSSQEVKGGCFMKLKKLGLLVGFLAAFPSLALASRIIPMERTVLEIPNSTGKVVQKDFSEGNRKMHFVGGRSNRGLPGIVVVRKGHFLEADSALWANFRTKEANRRIAYLITQFKDTDTGRYFYGVEPGLAHSDIFFDCFLIGYDRTGKKVKEFVDSKNYYAPHGYDLEEFITHRGDFYLAKLDFGRFQEGTVYKLIWNQEKDQFGYKQVDPSEAHA